MLRSFPLPASKCAGEHTKEDRSNIHKMTPVAPVPLSFFAILAMMDILYHQLVQLACPLRIATPGSLSTSLLYARFHQNW